MRISAADYWVGVNVKRVQDLWLDRSQPLDILDLGCGPGYFLYVSGMFGHKGLGLDPDDEPFFRGTTKLFSVNRVVARINAQTPLPDLDKRFDLVTAHRVCFHRIARRENGEWLEWTEVDWKFFIDDVRTRFRATWRATPPGIQSARGRLFIFHTTTARVL